MPEALLILSVNVGCSLATLTALLASSNADDILLVQEPYWGPLVPRHSDTDPDGVPVTGTVAHPAPHPTEYPWVASFVWHTIARSLMVVPDTLIDEYFALALSFTLPAPFPMLTVVNFYHHVINHQPQLDSLLACTVDPARCLLLCGDFNMHLDLWSLVDIHPSPWAPALEEWLDSKSLWSLVPDRAITCRRGSSKPSLIDLMLGSPGFFELPAYPGTCTVFFSESLGSDHAALAMGLPLAWTLVSEPGVGGWRAEPALHATWVDQYRGWGHTPQTVPSSKPELYEAAAALTLAINDTSKSVLQPRKVIARRLPWWNNACRLAVAALHGVHSEDHHQAYSVLRMTIQMAKRTWFEDLLEDPDVLIWDLAKWRHRRRAQSLPPIQDGNGLTMDGEWPDNGWGMDGGGLPCPVLPR
jgi:hypothetical protein